MSKPWKYAIGIILMAIAIAPLVVVSVPPFDVVATPFQLVYVILSIGLACFALLVCLVRYFLSHYIHLHRVHLPTRRQMTGFVTAKWLNH